MPLIVVQNDAEWTQLRLPGIFAIPAALRESPAHWEHALKWAQERMIDNARRLGYQYVDRGFDLEGPLDHTEFSESAEEDPGSPPPIDPRPFGENIANYVDACAVFEKAEKARVAWSAADLPATDLVDYRLTGTFRRRLPKSARTLPHSIAGAKR